MPKLSTQQVLLVKLKKETKMSDFCLIQAVALPHLIYLRWIIGSYTVAKGPRSNSRKDLNTKNVPKTKAENKSIFIKQNLS